MPISTDGGLRRVDIKMTGPETVWASVEMGVMSACEPPQGWQLLEVDPLRPVAHLSIGNPHAVVLVDDVDAVDLVAAGRAVPDVNLEVVSAGPDTGALTMRVHERGVGITEACGTGACAAAFAAQQWGLVGDRVVVHMLGGDGEVTIDGGSVDSRRPRRAHRRHRGIRMSLIERTIRERIVLVGVTLPPSNDDETESSSRRALVARRHRRGGGSGADRHRRDRPDPATFIGKGKVDELREVCLEVDADTVVFDNELTPAQQYNLEKLLGRTALDRTAVILDIFAQNAHTLEGKAQVELAMLRYRLPRLRRGARGGLSQQAGASAPEVPVRRSSRSIVVACSAASRSSSRISSGSRRPEARSARPAPAAG